MASAHCAWASRTAPTRTCSTWATPTPFSTRRSAPTTSPTLAWPATSAGPPTRCATTHPIWAASAAPCRTRSTKTPPPPRRWAPSTCATRAARWTWAWRTRTRTIWTRYPTATTPCWRPASTSARPAFRAATRSPTSPAHRTRNSPLA